MYFKHLSHEVVYTEKKVIKRWAWMWFINVEAQIVTSSREELKLYENTKIQSNTVSKKIWKSWKSKCEIIKLFSLSWYETDTTNGNKLSQ